MNFRLYWRDGMTEVVSGRNPADAMNARGYGYGALGALDFYARGDKQKYTWHAEQRKWVEVVAAKAGADDGSQR